MSKNIPIIVFGYSFPHRKTYDFISMLFSRGFHNITLIGAPKKKLTFVTDKTNKSNALSGAANVKNICSILNIEFRECAHEDVSQIAEIVKKNNVKLGIISGARIIKKEVIDLFDDGILNFHPGKIPETSGLDSFYYAIHKNCEMGVTAHLIDQKVDAGKFVFFEKLKIEANQTAEKLRENLYGLQLVAFRRYLDFYFARDICHSSIDRPMKNKPLNEFEREAILSKYEYWIQSQADKQQIEENKFFDFCRLGDLKGVKTLLQSSSYLLHHKSPEGWCGLIVASFWQRLDLVRYFLEVGANPNETGKNGTSVLMYAKTKLLDEENPNLELISLLLEVGANPLHEDRNGKNIFDYLDEQNSSGRLISEHIKRFSF